MNKTIAKIERYRELLAQGKTILEISRITGNSPQSIRYVIDQAPVPPIEKMDRSIIPPGVPRQHHNYFLMVAYEQGRETAIKWTHELMLDDA